MYWSFFTHSFIFCFIFHYFSGGRLVFAMSEKYIRDKTEFFKNLEPTMKRHEDSGLWRMVERKIVPKYLENDNGLVFIFEVVWKRQQNGCKTTSVTFFLHCFCSGIVTVPVMTCCSFVAASRSWASFTNIVIPAWISNHMPRKVWFEHTYSFLSFNGCTVEVWWWISNFAPHFIIGMIT